MDTASIHETRIGTAVSEAKERHARQPVDGVRASGFFAFAHVLAMLLALAAGVLLEHSLLDAAWGMGAIVCLAVAVAVLMVGRWEYRRALIADARRGGMSEAAAKDEADRRLEQLSRHRAPSPW